MNNNEGINEGTKNLYPHYAMAIPITPLTEVRIKSAKSKDRLYRIFDGNGLCLKILVSGNKVWEYRFKSPVTLKDATFTIGPYPDISLSSARKIHNEKRLLVLKGGDPNFHETDTKTFKAIFDEWWAWWAPQKNDDYANQTRRFIYSHSLRRIGNIKIDALTVKDISSAIQPFIKRQTFETAKRMKSIIAQAIDFAIDKGLLESNPARALSNNFMPANRKPLHHQSLKLDEIYKIHEYFNLLAPNKVTALAVELLLRTLARAQEVCMAKWEYVDFDRKILTIPADLMKKKNEHIIPLSRQAFGVIVEMRAMGYESEYIFPNIGRGKKKHISPETPTRSLREQGVPTTAHGFRSLASTLMYDTLEYHKMPDIIIEECLAHIDSNKVRAIYNKAKYINQKRILLQFWSDSLDKCKTVEGNIKMLEDFKITA